MEYVTIKGVQYPAVFSLRVALRTAEKYGSLQKIFEAEKEADNIQMILWLLHELLVAGKLYAENHSLRSFDVLGALLAFHIDMEIERRYIADEIAESGMPEDLKDVPRYDKRRILCVRRSFLVCMGIFIRQQI